MRRTINETVIAKRTFETAIRYYGRTRQFRVEAKLYQLGNNQRPYFNVTGTIYQPLGDIEAGGCLHDETLKHFPQLAPIVALHLADDDGVPMHGLANGWYWMAGALGGAVEQYHGGSGSDAKTPDQCLTIFADHCRISIDEAGLIRDELAILGGDADAAEAAERAAWDREYGPILFPKREWDFLDMGQRIGKARRACFAAAKARCLEIMDGMRPRWKAEAEAGLAFLKSTD